MKEEGVEKSGSKMSIQCFHVQEGMKAGNTITADVERRNRSNDGGATVAQGAFQKLLCRIAVRSRRVAAIGPCRRGSTPDAVETFGNAMLAGEDRGHRSR